MKKVCHLSSAHLWDDTRIFHLECVSLATNGYEVYLVAEGKNRVEQGVHIVGLGERPSNRFCRMIFFSAKAYRAALELNCDIYHIHDPELLHYAYKLKKHGKKVIFDSHENTFEQIDEVGWIPRFAKKIVSFGYRHYASFVMGRIDGCISVTPRIVRQLKDINKNSWMITNYPRTKKMHDHAKRNNKLLLCFTGGIESQWNHEKVIQAIADDDAIEYHICGWGSDAYINKLKKLSGWKNVRYYGPVSHEKALEIQACSDVGIALLTPSLNTGGKEGTLGNTKLFEYMMIGLPLICTDFEIWKRIMNKWNCGICVDPSGISGIREAIDLLRERPDVTQRMGLNARKAAENEYNWEMQERMLLKIYGWLLSDNDKGGVDY